jgi:hypothetical protein
MEEDKTRLPRASSLAYTELRQPAQHGLIEAAAAPTILGPAVLGALQQLKAKDSGGVLERRPDSSAAGDSLRQAAARDLAAASAAHVCSARLPFAASRPHPLLSLAIDPPSRLCCSAIVAALQGGQCSGDDAVRRFRRLCSTTAYDLFNAGLKAQAQAASDLLDAGNAALVPHLPPLSPANGSAAAAAPPPPPGALPAPRVPPEPFFLPLAQISDVLTISVDAAAAQALPARPPLPPAPKRGRGRGRGGPVRRRPATPSIFTPEFQAELATALRLALKHPGSPGPGDANLAALPPLLAVFSEELRESGACQGMRAMGAAMPGVCATLQGESAGAAGGGRGVAARRPLSPRAAPLPKPGAAAQALAAAHCSLLPWRLPPAAGGFAIAEEVVGALAAEAHAAAEAYLQQQNPDVRRGKVLGAAEAFVNFAAAKLDSLLGEVASVSKAAREARAAEAGVTESAQAEHEYQGG